MVGISGQKIDNEDKGALGNESDAGAIKTAVPGAVFDDPVVSELFSRGAHIAYTRRRRHPTARPFLFGKKDQVDVFDLRKTAAAIEKAEGFLSEMGKKGKILLFVGTKAPAHDAVKAAAEKTDTFYVITRWIGGFLTNWPEVKKRIERLAEIEKEEAAGELEKYTKKEAFLIAKEKEDLEKNFGGVAGLSSPPDVLVVIDAQEEAIAVDEARRRGIPVVALCNSDCDFSIIDFPIPVNDAARKSIEYVVGRLAAAYASGREARGSDTGSVSLACPVSASPQEE